MLNLEMWHELTLENSSQWGKSGFGLLTKYLDDQPTQAEVKIPFEVGGAI